MLKAALFPSHNVDIRSFHNSQYDFYFMPMYIVCNLLNQRIHCNAAIFCQSIRLS